MPVPGRFAQFLILLTALVCGATSLGALQSGGPQLTTQDYIDIQQLYARYTHAIDGGDAEGYAALFTSDGSFNTNVGHDALVTFIKNRNGANTRHMNVNLVITPTAAGAKGSIYNFFLDVGQNPPVMTGFSRYEDTLVKTANGWRFKTRVNRREGPAATTAPAVQPGRP